MLKRRRLEIIRKWYPNAITTIDTMNKLIDFVEGELDLEPSQIMLADSICSDDVNSIQYPVRASEFLGPFKMGGLNGFPFVGLTGMSALSSHVPDDGGVILYYGPHIGVTRDGKYGEIHRVGQSENTSCCGAIRAAMDKLIRNEIQHGHFTDLDHQMNTIEQILLKQKDRILAGRDPLFEATEVIYEANNVRIEELVAKTTFKCNYLLLFGAVLINSDSDLGSYNSVKRATLISVATGERRDLTSNFE